MLAKAGGVFGFQPEIKLPQEHPAALLGNTHPIPAAAPAGMALHYRGELLQHLQIGAKHPLQARALHLEHHLPTAAQAGAMHLGQAGGTEGGLLQVNNLSAALTQFLLQQPLHHVEAEGRHLVLQARQLLHQFSRQHIGPG